MAGWWVGKHHNHIIPAFIRNKAEKKEGRKWEVEERPEKEGKDWKKLGEKKEKNKNQKALN